MEEVVGGVIYYIMRTAYIEMSDETNSSSTIINIPTQS